MYLRHLRIRFTVSQCHFEVLWVAGGTCNIPGGIPSVRHCHRYEPYQSINRLVELPLTAFIVFRRRPEFEISSRGGGRSAMNSRPLDDRVKMNDCAILTVLWPKSRLKVQPVYHVSGPKYSLGNHFDSIPCNRLQSSSLSATNMSSR